MNLKEIGLSIYSFGYSAGFLSQDSVRIRRPVDLMNFPEISKEFNLGVIEFPFDRYFSQDRVENGFRYIREVRDQEISAVVDIENFDRLYISKIIPYFRKAGISFFRVKMSNYFGGNRYKIPNFQSEVEVFEEEIKSLIPIMNDYRVKLLIENHQDLSSEDIVRIILNTSEEWVGVNWDIGNSLAVGELPEQFLENVGPFLGNVHLKDYKVIPSQRGFGLLRCPLGSGVLDLRNLLGNLIKNANVMPMSIELGAQQVRHCDVFLDEYWKAYPGRREDKKYDFLEFINGIIEPAAMDLDSQNQKEVAEDLCAREFSELRRSVDFLEALEI